MRMEEIPNQSTQHVQDLAEMLYLEVKAVGGSARSQ